MSRRKAPTNNIANAFGKGVGFRKKIRDIVTQNYNGEDQSYKEIRLLEAHARSRSKAVGAFMEQLSVVAYYNLLKGKPLDPTKLTVSNAKYQITNNARRHSGLDINLDVYGGSWPNHPKYKQEWWIKDEDAHLLPGTILYQGNELKNICPNEETWALMMFVYGLAIRLPKIINQVDSVWEYHTRSKEDDYAGEGGLKALFKKLAVKTVEEINSRGGVKFDRVHHDITRAIVTVEYCVNLRSSIERAFSSVVSTPKLNGTPAAPGALSGNNDAPLALLDKALILESYLNFGSSIYGNWVWTNDNFLELYDLSE